MVEDNRLDSLMIYRRPVLIGSTWYTYGKDAPAWGVAQSELLINKAPLSLLLAPTLICDQLALEQEQRARDKMGWTSSEVLVELKEKGILKPENFGSNVKLIFQEKSIQKELDRVLNADVPFPQLLQQIRYIDNIILDGLLPKDTDTPTPDPRQAFFWQGDPLHSRSFWSRSEAAVFSLYFDSDFYVLPPREIWPQEPREALAEITKRQAPYFELLARLRLEPELYIRKIKDAHGNYDKIVDKFLRAHSAPPYGNYRERLDLLLKARQALHSGGIFENVALAWERVRRQEITEEEFRMEFNAKIKNETNGLLKALSDKNTDIAVLFVFDLLAYGVATAEILGASGSAPAEPANLLSPAIGMLTLTSQLIRSIFEQFRLKHSYPMGWFNLAKESIAQKAQRRAE